MNEKTAEHGPTADRVFIKHVGWAIRCRCGADYVAGYPCPVEEAGR